MLVTLERTDPVRVVRRLKPGGGTRVFTRLSHRDAVTWHDLAHRVARVLEGALDERVAANRVVTTARSRWRLEDVGRASARARKVTAVHVGTVLHTDVEAFYASVRPEVLAACLRAVGVEEDTSLRAAGMLEGWSRWGCLGLPVGPPGSAVMANAVLVPVDRTLGTRPFVRWVDDYRISVATEADARAVLGRIDTVLASLRLRRSTGKTVTGPAGDLRFPGSDYAS